jgi:phosphoglycerol transferase MdoB-like AlkP superfamily enzyme
LKADFASIRKDMNVVILLAESLSTHKTSLSIRPSLNATPFLKQLADSSIYFSNCFTPHYGTARAIWNLFTGIPDVNWENLETHQLHRNTSSVLLNQLSFAKKFYLLGGDGRWADIKGFLKSNVLDLEFKDAEQIQVPSASVWGADDYDLLLQADQIFQQTDQPFFAVVQTASNHAPYIIPEAAYKHGFVANNQTAERLNHFGFANNKEYNSLRYLDFCLQSFFKNASRSSYYQNTLFIIVGDHGTIDVL